MANESQFAVHLLSTRQNPCLSRPPWHPPGMTRDRLILLAAWAIIALLIGWPIYGWIVAATE